jgi:hypothetical protein
MPVSFTRVLVLLLAFRAVVAPFTYRPSASDRSHRHTLTMGIRWWPPQRLQRFSGSSKLLQLFQGKNRVASDEDGRLPGVLARWPSPQSMPGALALCVFQPLPAGELITCLRC